MALNASNPVNTFSSYSFLQDIRPKLHNHSPFILVGRHAFPLFTEFLLYHSPIETFLQCREIRLAQCCLLRSRSVEYE